MRRPPVITRHHQDNSGIRQTLRDEKAAYDAASRVAEAIEEATYEAEEQPRQSSLATYRAVFDTSMDAIIAANPDYDYDTVDDPGVD